MKKFAMFVMLLCIFCTLGNKGCDKPTEEVVVRVAHEALEKTMLLVIDPVIARRCAEDRLPDGGWTDENCERWYENEVCRSETITKDIPWAIEEAYEWMTDSEREKFLDEIYRSIAIARRGE